MRFSTVLVTSSLVLSGLTVAHRFGDYDLYSRSFDSNAIAELHARSFVDDDFGLYIRSLMTRANGAADPAVDPAANPAGDNTPSDPTTQSPSDSTPPTSDPTASGPQTDVTTGNDGASGPGLGGDDKSNRGGQAGRTGKGGHAGSMAPNRHSHNRHGHRHRGQGNGGIGNHPNPSGSRLGRGSGRRREGQ
ncbi:hypothetical protein AX14_003143 [Amanita brunnescens Koide BX004]|nr:hypothetical protein AX14_003143 [Amanita brunnescens Koide BX004]